MQGSELELDSQGGSSALLGCLGAHCSFESVGEEEVGDHPGAVRSYLAVFSI